MKHYVLIEIIISLLRPLIFKMDKPGSDWSPGSIYLPISVPSFNN